MKKKIIEKTKNLGLLLVAIICILFYFTLKNLDIILANFLSIFNVLLPFIIGFAIAFFLNPLVLFLENNVLNKFNLKKNNIHTLSCIAALIIGIIFVVVLCWLIIPQFIHSLTTLGSKSEIYLKDFSLTITKLADQYNINTSEVNKFIGNSSDIFDWLLKTLNSSNILLNIANAGFSIVKQIFNILVGIMAGLYLMLDRDKFLYQVRKINYTLFNSKVANYLSHIVDVTKNVFYDFVVGKAIDSMIIGLLCFFGMKLLGLEYAVLLSVIVGITNMIPVFGPFIGAVPGLFILFIINPLHALIFGIFILILQQIDGNIIGPIILGDKLGLPSFWILFSVTFGGAFFGVVGMFVGVPVFTVIYYLFRDYINLKNNEKRT